MNPICPVLACLGLLAWPCATPVARLRSLRQPERWSRWHPTRLRRPGTVPTTAGVAAGGFLALGWGGAVATAIVAATVHRQLAARRAERARVSAIEGLAEALRAFAEALRSGAHPVDAAESAAAEAHPDAIAVMAAIASAARLGGDVERALDVTAERLPALRTDLRQLGVAVRLAHRHGLPLADVVDAARRDLHLRARHAATVQARMAGPRATATVLAGLPLVGLALGQAVGAAPVHVLADTGAGQLVLVIGAALICAGLAWTARLTNQAALR